MIILTSKLDLLLQIFKPAFEEICKKGWTRLAYLSNEESKNLEQFLNFLW